MLLGAAKARGYSNADVIVKMSTNPQAIFCIPVQEDTYCDVELSNDGVDAHGRPVLGTVTRTVIRGDVAFLDGKIFVASGQSEHLAPTTRASPTSPAKVPVTPARPAEIAAEDSGEAPYRAAVGKALTIAPTFGPVGTDLTKAFTNQLIERGLLTLSGQSVTSIGRFDRDSTHHLFNIAHDIRFAHPSNYNDLLKGKVLATIFYEPSTRTHCSFQAAMQRLGGSVISLDQIQNTSVKKGESFSDFIRTMNSYVDAIVLRHPEKGSVATAAEVSSKPVINAGDGVGEHPTQALLDVFTIREELGTVNGLNVTVVGDLKHSRTVHSLVKLLANYRVTLRYVSPASLGMPQDVKDKVAVAGTPQSDHTDLKEVLADTDVLYVTRIQQERFDSPEAYEAVKSSYVIDAQTMSECKERMVLMHPLPRVDEISPEVDTDPRAAYFRQMEYGVSVRMALLAMILSQA